MSNRRAWPKRQPSPTTDRPSPGVASELAKAPTGIPGLDEITMGGFPRGRPTLVCGSPGAGKTLLAVSFLVNGVRQFDEPGVLITFEENLKEISQDVASRGFDLQALIDQGKLAVDYVHIERSEIEETGEYDLEGLFVRLALAVDSVGAKRVVLDTIESLFGGFSSDSILRAELRRLFRWLKDRGLTTVIMGERGAGNLTRQELEEYVSVRRLPEPDRRSAERYVLRLYVAGMTPRSIRAIANVRAICDAHLEGRYELEVIDIYQQRVLAKGEQIVAAPTLIKQLPAPFRRIIGDLSNKDRVLVGLDLRPRGESGSETPHAR